MNSTTIYYIMGVSGSGKTTIGESVANHLGIPFFDGDDYHPKRNVDKMSKGQPLDDEDRKSWLLRLNTLSKEHSVKGAVIACSALKHSYRDFLKEGLERKVKFVYLSGSFEIIFNRMQKRKGHFMPADLLKSQFETLEPPKNAISVSIDQKPEDITAEILKRIGQ